MKLGDYAKTINWQKFISDLKLKKIPDKFIDTYCIYLKDGSILKIKKEDNFLNTMNEITEFAGGPANIDKVIFTVDVEKFSKKVTKMVNELQCDTLL